MFLCIVGLIHTLRSQHYHNHACAIERDRMRRCDWRAPRTDLDGSLVAIGPASIRCLIARWAHCLQYLHSIPSAHHVACTHRTESMGHFAHEGLLFARHTRLRTQPPVRTIEVSVSVHGHAESPGGCQADPAKARYHHKGYPSFVSRTSQRSRG